VRRLPADLAAVVVVVGLTDLFVFAPVLRETPLRVVFGLAFVLFVPGYAFVAALFPEEGESPTGDDVVEEDEGEVEDGTDRLGVTDRSGIDGIERVALSFGLSIAVVPLLGLVLNFTPWGIRLVPIAVTVSGFTLASTAVGAHRRWELPAEERFAVPYRSWLAAGRAELFDPDSRADAALNVLLVASILLAAGSVTYAVAVPKEGEQFTEFYLLTENESGDLVAAGYPTNMTRGESASVVVGVGNQEHESVEYTVVVELQRVTIVNETDSTTNATTVRVLDERELRRFEVALAHNETWHNQHTVTPTMTGDRLRLQYLLYRGEPPADPSGETAYRELHLWVNVSTGG
jgi:uncharacterized membrane protein